MLTILAVIFERCSLTTFNEKPEVQRRSTSQLVSLLATKLMPLLWVVLLLAPPGTSALGCLPGGTCNYPNTKKIVYVDGVANTLQSAINAANDSGNTSVIVLSSQTVPSGLTLRGNGVELICQNNAILTAGAGGFWMLTITGTGNALRDCSLSPGESSSAFGVLVNGASNTTIEKNTISGFEGGNGLIYLVRSTGAIIRNNRLTTGSAGPDGIFGEINTTDATVDGNYVDESLGNLASHAIAFHSTLPGQSISGIKIVNNKILAGMNFCVEVGAFGGLTPNAVVVAHNSCNLTKNGGSGGYSIGASASTLTANTFNADGFTATIAAYEIVESANSDVTNNSAMIGQAWSSVPTSAATINRSHGINFSHNMIDGWGGGDALAASGWGLTVGSSNVSDAVVTNNIISANVFVFPRGLGSGGIFQQCLTVGSDCSDNQYSGNVLVSDGTAHSVGFRVENDNGKMKGTTISENNINGPSYGIYLWNPTVIGTHIYRNVIKSTSPSILDSGTNTVTDRYGLSSCAPERRNLDFTRHTPGTRGELQR